MRSAAPDQLQLAATEAPTDPALTEKPLGEATQRVVRSEEAQSVDSANTAKSLSQPVAEVTAPTSHARIMEIDGVSIPIEQNSLSLARHSIKDAERMRLRIQGSKVTSVLRTLVTYENMLADGPSLAPDEIGRLTRIVAVIEGIPTQSNNDRQNKRDKSDSRITFGMTRCYYGNASPPGCTMQAGPIETNRRNR